MTTNTIEYSLFSNLSISFSHATLDLIVILDDGLRPYQQKLTIDWSEHQSFTTLYPPPPHPTPITPKSRAKKGLRYQVVLQSSEGIGLIKCFIILEKFKTRTVYISYSELIVYDGE